MALLTAGRLSEQKNHASTIRAIGILRESGIPVRLTVAGDGPLRRELEVLSASLGLSDAVSFAGFVSDLSALRRECDIYVQASLYEGLCLSVVEALAAGMLVVSTDVGGVRTYGVDGRNMVKSAGPGPQDLARAVTRALSVDSREIRRAGFVTARERFGPDAVRSHWRAAVETAW
jgi:glycosyltransferase involved in cell wall biosynthesis